MELVRKIFLVIFAKLFRTDLICICVCPCVEIQFHFKRIHSNELFSFIFS